MNPIQLFVDVWWLKHNSAFGKKLLFFFFSGVSWVLFSQEVSNKKKESLNDTWVHYANPDIRYGIDSTIVNLEEYNGMQRPGSEYLNVGNTGSAAYPLVFSPFRFKGFHVGFNQFDAYRYTFDSTRIYKVMRPYSQLQYIVGQRAEQMFNGKFAGQMFKEKLQFGVDFTRFNSRGGYINQSTNVNGFTLYGFYEPQKRNYSLQTILLLNLAQVKENGGVNVDVFASGNSFFSKELVPVRLQTAKNNYSEVRWMARGAYHLGKYQTAVKDSTTFKRKVPTFKIGFQTGLGREKFNYLDRAPDSIYYQAFWTGKDSLRYDLSVFHFSNSAFMEFTGQIAKNDTHITQTPFKASASLHYDHYYLRETSGKYGWGNMYINAVFQNNTLSNSKFLYKTAVAYYLTGYNQNDLRLDGLLGYDLEKYGKVAAIAHYHLTEAPLIWQSYSSRGKLWSNDFPKQNVLALGGSYIFHRNWISVFADATYHFVKNYFYFQTPSSPMSDASNAHVLIIHAGNKMGMKGIHFDNDFWFQPVASSSSIRIPLWVTRHSIYYENRIFKKVLWFSIGFDVRYNSPFFGNEYFPLTGQWILQNNYLLRFYPVLDGFLNFKVRWFRLTAKVENISSTFGPGGYYTAPNYPAADIAFKMGVVWRFFE